MRTETPISERHPFRRAVITARSRKEEDLKLFALSFTAFFVCFYTFLM